MHNGQFLALENVIGFYKGVSDQARITPPAAGSLLNGADALRGIALKLPDDRAPLVAFLKSLNEDYQ
jgi:cytochrome c peroxidase